MARRVLSAFAAAAAALLLAGCAGLTSADGREAEQLLQQAHAAQAELDSMTFRMRMSGEVAGQAFTMTVNGGGYLQGEEAGDYFMKGSMEIPGLPVTDFEMVLRNGRMWAALGGQWQELPVPAGALEPDAQLENELANIDFSRFVKDVQVEHDTTFLGEPVTKIVGTIDTAAMLDTFLGQLGSLGGPLGTGGLPNDFTDGLKDTRVVIYVSDETHVVRAARITLALEYEGEEMTMKVDYFLDSVNEPIEIPTPSA